LQKANPSHKFGAGQAKSRLVKVSPAKSSRFGEKNHLFFFRKLGGLDDLVVKTKPTGRVN
jgi:hypothetical protein